MLFFLYHYFVTLSLLIFYGFIGGFSIAPFCKTLKYPLLAAPIAGMLLLGLGVYLLYCLAITSISIAILIVALTGSGITIGSLFFLKPKIDSATILSIITALIVCAVITYLVNFTSIQLNDISFLFRDGSDHLGYVAMADWLKEHSILQLPVETNKSPYESFPALLVKIDPRFLSFFSLAIISTLLDQSSTFAFDNACTIVLLVGYLGVASVFARTPKSLVLLTLGLLVNFWFLLSRMGYFGKILGLPAIIYILGLYFTLQLDNFPPRNRNFAIIVLLILTFAASMAYPGFVLSSFLISVGGLFLLLTLVTILWRSDFTQLSTLRDKAGWLLIMVLIGMATAGRLSLPSHDTISSEINLDWNSIFLYQLDISYFAHDLVFDWYTANILHIFLCTWVGMLIIALICTLQTGAIIASSLIGSSLLLFVIPILIGNKWVAYELVGTLFTLAICGCTWYLSDLANLKTSFKQQALTCLFYFIMMIAIALRIPSLVESIHRYVMYGVPPFMQYSKQEIDTLAKIINTTPVTIDIPNVMFSLPILVEFGRLNTMNLHWTNDSWKSILGYRDWHLPSISPTPLVLGLTPDTLALIGLQAVTPDNCHLVFTTRQYRLFDCSKLKPTVYPLTYRNS